eukprot:TRINITY_DN2410_c0_g1_i2.p1 TRINITY_DN2410_c0_g1~~TRINITY_DN2410_c0_g1_i2.p1  ORF type:complete len:365 (+),score=12.60 TRINITY_DN2410_c0_g1_i2:107-1201(+)
MHVKCILSSQKKTSMEPKSSLQFSFSQLVKEFVDSFGCTGTIDSLKVSLEKSTGIYRSLFTINYNSTAISPETPLRSLKSEQLTVVLCKETTITINFELKDDPARKSFIKMLPENTITELMQAIKEKFHIPVDQQRLYLMGKALRVGTLKKRRVDNGSKIVVSAKTFEMNFKILGGSQYSVLANALLTIDQLREKMQGLKPELEGKFIRFEGMYTGQKLGEINVNDKEMYEVAVFDSVPANVFTKRLSGGTLTIQVDLNEYVYELKVKISNREGIPADAIRLIYSGLQLEDNLPLSCYKIENKSTIHMALRLRGCQLNLCFEILPDLYYSPIQQYLRSTLQQKLQEGEKIIFIYKRGSKLQNKF